MARPKLPRKSTSVDMTAMCDVAFLLLSFFILTTKFKAPESVPIETPNSVSSKPAPEKNVITVSINKDGKVFLSLSEDSRDKQELLVSTLNTTRGLGLTDAEVKQAGKVPFFGTSLGQLKSFLAVPADKMKGDNFPGIPAKDSTNNEMVDWMRAVTEVYRSLKPNILLKGDMASKYPAFKNVIAAFKKNDILKFQMVTNAESVPEGTDLYRTGAKGAAE